MDIILVNPDHKNPYNNFPWGLLAIGSYIRNKCKKEVQLIDVSIVGETAALQVIRQQALCVPIIGLACMSMDTPFVKIVADTVKSVNPTCKVLVGGAHAVLYPEQTVRYKNIDFVAYTEGEQTTEHLLEELRSTVPDLSRVPGLVYKENGKVYRTPSPVPTKQINIDYSLLDEKVRATFGDYIQVLTGRGCSYKCTFCYNVVCEQPWRPRSTEELVDEIRDIVDYYNPKVIYFRDENFFQNRKRVKEFLRLYHHRGFQFAWRATCRADYFNDRYINNELLLELADTRCQILKFGFESGSQRILDILKKKMQIKHLRRTVLSLAKIPQIRASYSFMIGIPGETYDDYRATIGFIGWILSVDPEVDVIGPQYFRMYSGGELYKQTVHKYRIKMPNTFEEWVALYSCKGNEDGWDKGIEYPWVPRRGRYVAKNADKLIRWRIKAFYLFTSNPIGNSARFCITLFHYLMRFRLRMGWYSFFWELYFLKRLVFIRHAVRRIFFTYRL